MNERIQLFAQKIIHVDGLKRKTKSHWSSLYYHNRIYW